MKDFPKNNFYAVIFSSTKSDDLEGYAEMDEKTMTLAQEQPGYIRYESVANGNKGIFISYWESKEAIENWRKNATHQMAKSQAVKWYKRYLTQICLVESSHLYENL
ncbi:MAG: putative enzyme involved in biosynthesis of extracellular polysaccharide [Bacteroidetes bacterium]|jgi:heme-degrading monooxygenase HmoA|nr:putative enzyme involved in biosynthesis of extracellular polysaccharide [Bacteroidota bacterium]